MLFAEGILSYCCLVIALEANSLISPKGSPEHASQVNWVKFMPLVAYACDRVELMG